jgi:GTP-binding protein
MMMFIDEVTITVQSGAGGNGAISWRKEKYVPYGGPAGGDGGRGGSVFFEATDDMQTLLDFRFNARYEAPAGAKGANKNMHGKGAEDLVLFVPCGTIVKDAETQLPIADLATKGQRFLVANGGRGGRGNARFASANNKAPHYAEPGEAGIFLLPSPKVPTTPLPRLNPI